MLLLLCSFGYFIIAESAGNKWEAVFSAAVTGVLFVLVRVSLILGY